MRYVELNTIGTSRITFRLDDEDETPADPGVVTVSIENPAGTVTTLIYGTDPDVVRDGAGAYHVPVNFNVAGLWWVRWRGSGAGPNVAAEEDLWVSGAFASSTFGANLAGVMAYLPHVTVGNSTKITDDDVEQFIAAVEARIAVRVGGQLGALGTVTDDEGKQRLAEYRFSARNLAELGAAAFVEDARFPEGATVAAGDEAPYGNRLWARYDSGLKELAAAADAYLRGRGLGVAVGATTGSPSYSFPDATIKDDLGW